MVEWILLIGFFSIGYGLYRVELVCRAQLGALEGIGRMLDFRLPH